MFPVFLVKNGEEVLHAGLTGRPTPTILNFIAEKTGYPVVSRFYESMLHTHSQGAYEDYYTIELIEIRSET